MVDRIITNNTKLPCCYSFLKRTKIIFRKEEWDKIKQYDEENTRFLYPYNDGIYLDSIIDFEKLNLDIPGIATESSNISNTPTPQNHFQKKFKDIENMYLLIYQNIIMEKGIFQSLIYDLSERKLFEVPNSLIDFLHIQQNNTIGETTSHFSEDEKIILYSYVEFLISNRIARVVQNNEQFGTHEKFLKGFRKGLKISTTIIDSAIIDIRENSSYDIRAFLEKLTSFRCSKVLLRFWENNIDFF